MSIKIDGWRILLLVLSPSCSVDNETLTGAERHRVRRCDMNEKATFGAGCFWGVEAAFLSIDGVSDVTSGYMGGTTENPTYKQVCTGRTGHAEVVQVEYDPDVVSYEELLEVFWQIHDPTQKNRQGPDIGSQYRSVIFYHTPGQEQAARKSKRALEETGEYEDIATEISEAKTFWPAEDYHQRYYEKRGIDPTCQL